MNDPSRDALSLLRTLAAVLLVLPAAAAVAAADPVVPGTGRRIARVGDDFEDPAWQYIGHFPKSTENLDNRQRLPAGRSKNGRWYEGMKRGQPDWIRRVPTPAGGLPGSRGALALRSLQTGIPNVPSHRQQQDDLIADVQYRLGGPIPVWRTPSVVVRVYLPPVDQWEDRTGCHFAFRLALETDAPRRGIGLLARRSTKNEVYWPGMFIDFQSKNETGKAHDYASIRVRANPSGGDFKALQITRTGWWTMGISVTPDGMVHYYAKPGIDDLTPQDHITSQYPYSYRAKRFRTFFFNVCSGDDGRTWSTQWIIDDPTVYVLR